MAQKVLVCDDDREIAAAVDIYLTAEGYEVLQAYDGFQAIELLDKHPDVQLILMDIMMPRLDGRARHHENPGNPEHPHHHALRQKRG